MKFKGLQGSAIEVNMEDGTKYYTVLIQYTIICIMLGMPSRFCFFPFFAGASEVICPPDAVRVLHLFFTCCSGRLVPAHRDSRPGSTGVHSA